MLQNDQTYFFDDGSIVFQVESTLFRVHKHYFVNESPVFRDMFSLPVASENAEGTLERPILLEQVECEHFSALLWFFYRSQFSEEPKSPANTWTYILRLARKWCFDDVFTVATRKLSGIAFKNPMNKIRLAIEFDFPILWAFDACVSLCKRPKSLTVEEAKILPLETVVKFADLRMEWKSYVKRKKCSDEGFQSTVRFELENDDCAPPAKRRRTDHEEPMDVSTDDGDDDSEDEDYHRGYESQEV